jgi:hypothetical protein
MKDNFNVDVIISANYEIHDPMDSEIVLYGHMLGDEEASFQIGINHKTYTVNRIGGTSKLLDRRVKFK